MTDDWPDPLGEVDANDGSTAGGGGRVTEAEAAAPAGWRSWGPRLVYGVGALALVVRIVIVAVGDVDVWVITNSVFFVALPGILALMLTRNEPGPTAMARVLAGTTFALLVLAMVLGEGAVCVLLAAPLVYAAAALVTWVGERIRAGGVGMLVLLALAAGSPVGDGLTEVEVVREVPMTAATVHDRIEAGPRLDIEPRAWLLTLGYPVPTSAERLMVDGHTAWRFPYGHGATTFTMHATDRGYAFDVVEDSAMRRWFRWHDASLQVDDLGSGRTRVTLTARIDPALGPDWWFGWLEGEILEAAGGHLLDAMEVRQ